MQNLFILGSPRSGTTFLASLLKPTMYGSPFETQFILKYHNKISSYGDFTKLSNLTLLLRDICNERAIAQWQVEFNPDVVQSDLGENFTYTDLVDYICTKLMNKKGKSIWGDKTPHYILKVNQLIELYPEAKYLYIVRDGRDVALSLLKKPWGPNNVYKCAEQWSDANNQEQQVQLKSLEDKRQLLYIKYEELLDNTEEECSRIYKFLGDSIENHRDMVEELIAQTMSGNHTKWKKQMTPQQISTYEAKASSSLKYHGYELTTPNAELSTLKAFGYKVHHQLIYIKQMFVMNVVDGIKIKFFGKQPFNE